MLIAASFHPNSISDEGIAALRRLAVNEVSDLAPRFGSWLHAWLDREQFCRTTGEPREFEHAIGLICLDDWPSEDVADALRATFTLVYSVVPDSTEDFLGRLLLVATETSAERLKATK